MIVPKVDLSPRGRKLWKPIVKLTQHVPLGYTQDPERPLLLNPVVSELNYLEDAKKHLKKYTYKAVARWLSKKIGREVTPDVLKGRLELERRHKSTLEIKRRVAIQLQKILEEIELIEAGEVGSTSANARAVHDKRLKTKSNFLGTVNGKTPRVYHSGDSPGDSEECLTEECSE